MAAKAVAFWLPPHGDESQTTPVGDERHGSGISGKPVYGGRKSARRRVPAMRTDSLVRNSLLTIGFISWFGRWPATL